MMLPLDEMKASIQFIDEEAIRPSNRDLHAVMFMMWMLWDLNWICEWNIMCHVDVILLLLYPITSLSFGFWILDFGFVPHHKS